MNKRNVLHYLSQTFMIFGIITLLLNIFAMLFGEQAQEISAIFRLGSKGIDVSSSLQFLLAIALIVALRFIFETNFMIKKIPFITRIILLFAIALGIVIAFIFLFDWFPVNEVMPWIMFIVCFGISCGIGTIISTISEKQENRKLEEALRKFKEEQ